MGSSHHQHVPILCFAKFDYIPKTRQAIAKAVQACITAHCYRLPHTEVSGTYKTLLDAASSDTQGQGQRWASCTASMQFTVPVQVLQQCDQRGVTEAAVDSRQ